MKHSIRYQAYVAVAVMACVTVLAAGCGDKKSDGDGGEQKAAVKPTEGTQIGNIAPEIVGKDLNGKEFKLSDYRGKVVMLDFWAGW